MKRSAVLLIAVLALASTEATAASAAPAADLCVPDLARGAVPDYFLLDACVDATSVVLRNDLWTPVLVHTHGDLGRPVGVQQQDTAAAAVLREGAAPGVLLMPGDVVRWSLGAGAAQFDVSGLEPDAAPAIVGDLAPHLPRPGGSGAGSGELAAFAEVVRDVADAVEVRATCVWDTNFLQKGACDVAAASAIARAVTDRLPSGTAADLLPTLLDADNWSQWASSSGPPNEGTQLAVRPRARPAAVAAPAVPAPVVGPEGTDRRAAANPVSAHAVVPVPPVPAVSAPAVPVAAAPVPAAPVPAAPAPRPVPATPPPAPKPTVRSSWADYLAALLKRQATEHHQGGDTDATDHGKRDKGKHRN